MAQPPSRGRAPHRDIYRSPFAVTRPTDNRTARGFSPGSAPSASRLALPCLCLLPRIRNFQDLTFHRPDPAVGYRHIDPQFSTDPRTAIDWELIRRHWPDLMQVALSVKQGTVSSVTLLRRLNNRSRKNQVDQAFHEVGRAVRSVVLLRYLSDPALREQIQKATNKAEAYNGFTKWLHFGNAGWLASRDPELQAKAVKFLDLLASSVVFSTTTDMTQSLSRMAREGWTLNASDLAVLSPYRRENVLRFGDYTTDHLHTYPHPPTIPLSTPVTDRFRLKFVVGLGSRVSCRQDLLGVC
ncbi:Tn3 family transposase [Streptomyces massasporeus]|uniref:Tn3 family transposase n=1 Tax=Streptomyces massasporeus TaxID=67324 RepID=UPI0036807C5A